MVKINKKILIVEDDFQLLQMYEERLKQEGLEVITAPDGEKGLEVAINEKPDLILLDLMLPKKGGLGVLEVLKSWVKTRDIPVIVLTALPNAEYRDKAIRMGAVNHLIKSQSMPGQVIAEVKKALKIT